MLGNPLEIGAAHHLGRPELMERDAQKSSHAPDLPVIDAELFASLPQAYHVRLDDLVLLHATQLRFITDPILRHWQASVKKAQRIFALIYWQACNVLY